MFFRMNTSVTCLLESLSTSTIEGLTICALLAALLAFIMEGINAAVGQLEPPKVPGWKSWYHLIRTATSVLQHTLGYVVMLLVMTFNGWVIISVVTGGTLGYFLCRWTSIRLIVHVSHAQDKQKLLLQDDSIIKDGTNPMKDYTMPFLDTTGQSADQANGVVMDNIKNNNADNISYCLNEHEHTLSEHSLSRATVTYVPNNYENTVKWVEQRDKSKKYENLRSEEDTVRETTL